MSPLTLFIIFIIAVTFITTRYTLHRLKEPVKLSRSDLTKQDSYFDFWKIAETTNGRLAMMGLLALLINYGFFGWIVPGFF